MDSILRKAINERRLLEITYDGAVKMVEPHCYGVNAKGDLVFRAYEVHSESGKSAWRLFELSKVKAYKLLKDKFRARIDYAKGDKNMTHIHCEIGATENAS